MTCSRSLGPSARSDISVLHVTPSEPKPPSTDDISVRVRQDPDAALDAMGAEIDCVVAGHEPPSIDAPQFLERLRDRGHEQPFILYGPKIRSAVVETVLAAGGDYLCSESDTQARSVLAARIKSAVEADRNRRRLELKSRAMEQAPVGITIADAKADDEPITYVNERFERVTGYERSAVRGENCRFLQGAGTDEASVAKVRKAIEKREPVSVELLNYRRDETPFWNQLDIAPVREDGAVTHFFGFQKDVTEKKALEEDLKRQTELQERFASVVSHDLRNPLNLAKGRLQQTHDERDDPRLAEAADALGRMESLISDVLAMARHGTAVTDPEQIDLAAVARKAERIAGLTAEIDADLPAVEGDPKRVSTLFENLFRNALEHAGDDPTVRVGAFESGFYVEDGGQGIPESDRASAFDWGVTSTDHGTGYGLALVQTIARAHGWEVSVTEGTTGGARFEFTVDARPTVTE